MRQAGENARTPGRARAPRSAKQIATILAYARARSKAVRSSRVRRRKSRSQPQVENHRERRPRAERQPTRAQALPRAAIPRLDRHFVQAPYSKATLQLQTPRKAALVGESRFRSN